MFNKKAKSGKFFKRSISLLMALTMLTVSSAAIFFVNQNKVSANTKRLGYFNDADITEQTHAMMTGDNMLTPNSYMYASLTANPTTGTNVDMLLQFSIPGYEKTPLKVVVFPKDPNNNSGKIIGTYSITGSDKQVYITNLKQGGYNVHIYKDSVAPGNFVCKSDVSAALAAGTGTDTAPLLDSKGDPIEDASGNAVNVIYTKPKDYTDNTSCYFLNLPKWLIPYDCRTVKVALFAGASYRETVSLNIDHILYDYCVAAPNYVSFAADAQWGTSNGSMNYEAHFYKDSVKSENFICKATNLTLQ